MNQTIAESLPTHESGLFDELLQSCRNPRQSISDRVKNYICERVCETVDGHRREKVELRLQLYGEQTVLISVDLRSDMSIWTAVRQLTEKQDGWRFEWQKHGRLDNVSVADILETVRHYVAVDYGAEAESIVSQLDKLWDAAGASAS